MSKENGSFLKKGYKRTRKGIAVLYFFIGLIIVAILVCVAFFFLKGMDYSDKIGEGVNVRPYVEVTAAPNETPTPEPTEAPEDDIVDISGEPLETATPEPTSTPKPTAEPTETPEPTPVATETPAPTAIPMSGFSMYKANYNVPKAYNGIVNAVTKAQTYEPNDDKALILDGYAYIDNDKFDGSNVQVLVVVSHTSGKSIAYQAKMIEGVSGVDHVYTVSQNAAKTDFEVTINTAEFPNGTYGVGTLIRYTVNGKEKDFFKYTKTTFTVADGVATVSLEEPAANTEASDAVAGADAGDAAEETEDYGDEAEDTDMDDYADDGEESDFIV